MLTENLAAFVIAALALTGSPGPATLGLSAAAAAFGMRASLALMTSIIVGVLIVFAAAEGGLAGLKYDQPPNDDAGVLIVGVLLVFAAAEAGLTGLILAQQIRS